MLLLDVLRLPRGFELFVDPLQAPLLLYGMKQRSGCFACATAAVGARGFWEKTQLTRAHLTLHSEHITWKWMVLAKKSEYQRPVHVVFSERFTSMALAAQGRSPSVHDTGMTTSKYNPRPSMYHIEYYIPYRKYHIEYYIPSKVQKGHDSIRHDPI